MRYFYVFLIVLCLSVCGCGEEQLTQQFGLVIGEEVSEITGVPPEIQELLWLDPATETEKLLALQEGETQFPQPDWVEDAIKFRICVAEQQRVYYTKYIDADGIAILGNSDVTDTEFRIARAIVLRMIAKRPEIREWLTPAWGYYAALVSAEHEDSFGNAPKYACSGEEPSGWGAHDGFYSISMIRTDYWQTFVHEFAHSIHDRIRCYEEKIGIRFGHCYYDAKMPLETSDFQTRLKAAYQEAIAAGTWEGRYAETNYFEYWAEGVVMWYYGIGTDREFETYTAFAAHDPLLAALLSEWFHEESFYE